MKLAPHHQIMKSFWIPKVDSRQINYRVVMFSALCTQIAADLFDANYRQEAKFWANKLTAEADRFGAITYRYLSDKKAKNFEAVEDLFFRDLPGPEVKAAILVKIANLNCPEKELYEPVAALAKKYLQAIGKKHTDYSVPTVEELIK